MELPAPSLAATAERVPDRAASQETGQPGEPLTAQPPPRAGWTAHGEMGQEEPVQVLTQVRSTDSLQQELR